jgi:hypothetical protein
MYILVVEMGATETIVDKFDTLEELKTFLKGEGSLKK